MRKETFYIVNNIASQRVYDISMDAYEAFFLRDHLRREYITPKDIQVLKHYSHRYLPRYFWGMLHYGDVILKQILTVTKFYRKKTHD